MKRNGDRLKARAWLVSPSLLSAQCVKSVNLPVCPTSWSIDTVVFIGRLQSLLPLSFLSCPRHVMVPLHACMHALRCKTQDRDSRLSAFPSTRPSCSRSRCSRPRSLQNISLPGARASAPQFKVPSRLRCIDATLWHDKLIFCYPSSVFLHFWAVQHPSLPLARLEIQVLTPKGGWAHAERTGAENKSRFLRLTDGRTDGRQTLNIVSCDSISVRARARACARVRA